jgi:hypothetical protein
VHHDQNLFGLQSTWGFGGRATVGHYEPSLTTLLLDIFFSFPFHYLRVHHIRTTHTFSSQLHWQDSQRMAAMYLFLPRATLDDSLQ